MKLRIKNDNGVFELSEKCWNQLLIWAQEAGWNGNGISQLSSRNIDSDGRYYSLEEKYVEVKDGDRLANALMEAMVLPPDFLTPGFLKLTEFIRQGFFIRWVE